MIRLCGGSKPREIAVTCSPVIAACRVKIQRVQRITQYQYREGKNKKKYLDNYIDSKERELLNSRKGEKSR